MERPFVSSTTATASSNDQAPARGQAIPVPGLVLLFADRRPRARCIRLTDGSIELGRPELAVSDNLDPSISRRHARFSFDGSNWLLSDLGSRNGTFVRGNRVEGEISLGSGGVVRIGGALLLASADLTPFEQRGLGLVEGTVRGPALRKALDTVARVHRAGSVSSLMISGESGSGKELAAKVFHDSGSKPKGPFVAVNCATIPKDLAERLLFGSRRGAFSGATDAPGHVQAANGGTLFLDEVAELPLDVQSKLLRMLETREVLRLGSTSHEPVDVRICAASWRDLRAEVSAGRFREDLYFRIGQPEVRLPPLRERAEEVPWHIQLTLDDSGLGSSLSASSAFVEACMLRHWPGNVRELRAEVRRAAGAQTSEVLGADDLSPTAGASLKHSTGPMATSEPQFPADEVAAALKAANGNVVGAARLLGISRNKVRRWLERHAMHANLFRGTPR